MLRELSEGPNRSSHELAPAVRTTRGKHTLCTVPAEGAFEGTDKGVGGFRWQVYVATLAVWSYAAFHADFRHLARSGFLRIPPFRNNGETTSPTCVSH